MTKRVHGDAAEQVQVRLAVCVPDRGAGTAHQDALGRPEDAKQRGVIAAQQLLAAQPAQGGQLVAAEGGGSGVVWHY